MIDEEKDVMLRVADFSAYPIGRDDDDSDFNGQKFRKEWLLPKLISAIEQGGKLKVSFEGVRSFGSSFLEEAFGGLVSKEGLSKRVVQDTVVVLVEDGDSNRYDGVVAEMIKRAKPAGNM